MHPCLSVAQLDELLEMLSVSATKRVTGPREEHDAVFTSRPRLYFLDTIDVDDSAPMNSDKTPRIDL